MGLKIRYPRKAHLALFGGEIEEEQPFFKVKKEKTPNISSSNCPRSLIFGYVIQL